MLYYWKTKKKLSNLTLSHLTSRLDVEVYQIINLSTQIIRLYLYKLGVKNLQ